MQIETDVRGFDSMLIRVRAAEARLKEDIRQAIEEASSTAHAIMVNMAPRDQGRLAASVHQGPVRFAPGAAGGGGFYEAEVTAGEGVPYVNVVLEGSGIWGPRDTPITASNGNIRTKLKPEWRTTTGAKYMVFTPKGKSHPIRRKTVAGQRAQTAWLEVAREAAQGVVERKIAAMAARNL